jgi:acyl-CoA reductase-like NAD-dependent aldehyde dehydrogenase
LRTGDGREHRHGRFLYVVDVDRAADVAETAYPPWRALLPLQRGAILQCWVNLMRAQREDLVRLELKYLCFGDLSA